VAAGWIEGIVSDGKSSVVRGVLTKLHLTDGDDAHRRVLAVLAYLRAAAAR
jgi:hypothetical protein